MKKTITKIFLSSIAIALAACGVSEAPKCGDREVVALLVGELLKEAGLQQDGQKVTWMGSELPGELTGKLELVRERENKPEIKKRFCAGQSVIEISESEIPVPVKFVLAGINRVVNYTVQITEDGSTLVEYE